MSATIHDIARNCRVNASTVSRALNNDPRVKAATREKILQCAAEMDYRPNMAARNLASGRTNTLWLILPALFNRLEQEQAVHISNFVREHGMDLMIALYHGDLTIYERLLRQLEMKLTDGAFVLPPGTRTTAAGDVIGRLCRQRFPLVFLDRHSDLPKVSDTTVVTDNLNAVRKLADACLARGAEAIYPLFDSSNSAADERRAGLEGYPCISDISGRKKVAILCSSYSQLTMTLEKLRTQHPTVRFSAGVFDYWSGDSAMLEDIIVMPQNFAEMSRNGVDILMKMLNQPTARRPREIRIPPMEPQIIK